MIRRRAPALLVLLAPLSCQSLDHFDTEGSAAYCGSIVTGRPVRTPADEGGFGRIRMQLEVDVDALTSVPGSLTTDDADPEIEDRGPCYPRPTFDHAPLRVTPEVVSDSFSALVFEDGQVHNIVAWVDSTCRGSMLAVVSFYKNDRIGVRLLKPHDPGSDRDAFGRFDLSRSEGGCDFHQPPQPATP
jgi:hypothetical protein